MSSNWLTSYLLQKCCYYMINFQFHHRHFKSISDPESNLTRLSVYTTACSIRCTYVIQHFASVDSGNEIQSSAYTGVPCLPRHRVCTHNLQPWNCIAAVQNDQTHGSTQRNRPNHCGVTEKQGFTSLHARDTSRAARGGLKR
jgi:hypothetical protein